MKLKLIVLLLLIGINLQAEEEGATYSIALVGMSMDYREYDDNKQILDSEKSDFSGIIGFGLGMDYVFNATVENYSQFGLHLTTLAGNTQYVGAYLSGGSYGSATGNSLNTILDFDGEYLYGITISNSFDALVGGSLGYRSWERTLSDSQIETYSWAYINPEVGVNLQASQELQLRLMLGYKYAINPIMTATGINDNFKLGSANILHITFSTQYQIGEHSHLFVQYLYENQVITKSNVVYGSDGTGYLEPDSTANNQYLKFGVAFKY
jgi:hypothetical protein